MHLFCLKTTKWNRFYHNFFSTVIFTPCTRRGVYEISVILTTDRRLPFFLEKLQMTISRWCKIDVWSQWTTHTISSTASQMVTWPITSRDPKRSRYLWVGE